MVVSGIGLGRKFENNQRKPKLECNSTSNLKKKMCERFRIRHKAEEALYDRWKDINKDRFNLTCKIQLQAPNWEIADRSKSRQHERLDLNEPRPSLMTINRSLDGQRGIGPT